MAALLRNRAMQGGCQVPPLGLRSQNRTVGEAWHSKAPEVRGHNILGKITWWDLWTVERNLDGKQKLMTCQIQPNCLLGYAFPSLGLLSGHMPMFSAMYSHSTRGRLKF